jgi:hypothetical protein
MYLHITLWQYNYYYWNGHWRGANSAEILVYGHLSRRGNAVRAFKRFCAGDREDALVQWRLQAGGLDAELMNPWF